MNEYELNRHDVEGARLYGETMALEVAVTALLQALPDREALKSAWKDAEDKGFIWTSSVAEGVGDERKQWAQEAYVLTMNRLRKEALFP